MNKTTLKELRLQNKKSRAEVAQTLNVSVQAISNYESGIRQINIEQVLILADIFETTVEIIITAQINSCQ